MSDSEKDTGLAQILSSYFANNVVAPTDLPLVIETLKTALQHATDTASELNRLKPAVSVEDSVQPDTLACLCCGKRLKSLRQHLRNEHGLSPDEYRTAFGVRDDFPVVAPNFAKNRSSVSKSSHWVRKLEKGNVRGAADKKR